MLDILTTKPRRQEFNVKNGMLSRSFTSMADGAVITQISSSDKGEKVNAVLSFDDISTLANFGDSDEVNIKYKKIADDNAEFIPMREKLNFFRRFLTQALTKEQ